MDFREVDDRSLSERVQRARLDLGFTLKQASELLGFRNYQTLSSIESGKRNITASELSMMARLYGRELSYFFETDILPDPQPLWRKASDDIPQRIKRQFLQFLERYSKLENLFSLAQSWKTIHRTFDKSDFSQSGFKLVDRLSDDIGKTLGLGSRPAINLLNILENGLRIKVLHLSLDDEVSGGCLLDKKLGVGILINSKNAPWRRNYDLAHELFHIITWNVFSHEEVIGDGTQKTKPEQYADAFASSLLLPEKPLLEALREVAVNNQVKTVDIIELAKEFGISTEAVLWRLVNLNIIKRGTVKELLENQKIQQDDKLLRRGMYFKIKPSKFPERFISLTCKSLFEGRISRGTFANYIGIERPEIDSFLAGQGYVEENYENIATT